MVVRNIAIDEILPEPQSARIGTASWWQRVTPVIRCMA